jgi:hypothetical protein
VAAGDFVQKGSTPGPASTVVLGAAPTAGNLLIAMTSIRSASAPTTPTGWAQLGGGTFANDTDNAGAYFRVAGPGEPATVNLFFVVDWVCVMEFEGPLALHSSSRISAQTSTPTMESPALTPPAGARALLIGLDVLHSGEAGDNLGTPTAPWLERFDQSACSPAGCHPQNVVVTQLVGSAVGSYIPSELLGGNTSFGAASAAFIAASIPGGFQGEPGGAVW